MLYIVTIWFHYCQSETGGVLLLLLPPIVQVLLDFQKSLGKFCGQENDPDGNHPGNEPILSPGNKMSLVFQTDLNSEQHKGFSAHYQAIGKRSQSSGSSAITPLLVSQYRPVTCLALFF